MFKRNQISVIVILSIIGSILFLTAQTIWEKKIGQTSFNFEFSVKIEKQLHDKPQSPNPNQDFIVNNLQWQNINHSQYNEMICGFWVDRPDTNINTCHNLHNQLIYRSDTQRYLKNIEHHAKKCPDRNYLILSQNLSKFPVAMINLLLDSGFTFTTQNNHEYYLDFYESPPDGIGKLKMYMIKSSVTDEVIYCSVDDYGPYGQEMLKIIIEKLKSE